MNSTIIVLSIVLLLVVGVAVLIYVTFEKPIQDEKESISYVNLSVYPIDAINKKTISTNIKVKDVDIIHDVISTPDYPTLLQVVNNNSYYIYNDYVINQSYYSYVVRRDFLGETTPQRIMLPLIKAGNLSIELIPNSSKPLNKLGGELLLNLTTDNVFNNIKFCLKWSPHIITISVNDDFIEINKLDNFSNYDKCYSTNKSLISASDFLMLALNYKVFQDIDSRDFIRVLVYDENCILDDCYAYKDNHDVAGKNEIFEINNI